MVPAADRQSIRPFLDRLDRAGELLRIAKPVDPRFELSAFLSLADPGPAVLFEEVVGSPLRVAGNLLAGRARIADALGIAPAEISQRIHRAIRNPVPAVTVAGGPVQAIVTRDRPLAGLPVPTFFEREGRPYITAGVILARDPDSGRGNASFARLGILDDRRALVGIAPNHHLALFSRRAAALGRPLEIAVVIGAHPAIQLAACLYLGVGDDELECAGDLLGEPVEVVPAATIDLLVPAGAELVIEATLDARVPIEEGLISEYHGMYEDYGPGILATVQAVTRRADAIFQAIEPGYHREHIYLGALPIAAGLLDSIKRVVANVRDVAVTAAGAGRTDVVIQIDQPRPGQARRAIHAAFAAVSMVKRVTVVDGDVDPWDAELVDWARMHRMKLERDLMLFPHSGTDRSEAMEAGGLVTKIAYDATAKAGDRVGGIERAMPPAATLDAARAWLAEDAAARAPRLAEAMSTPKRIIVGISGASGAVIGIAALRLLREAGGYETHLVISPSGARTIREETELTIGQVEAMADVRHAFRDIGAAIASGSFRVEGMLVAPCSARTLGGIAMSLGDNLIVRAADVCLKERRRLVLLFRETPLHLGHIELMASVTRYGAIVMPPVPNFYTRPVDVDDIVTQLAARALDVLGVPVAPLRRWPTDDPDA